MSSKSSHRKQTSRHSRSLFSLDLWRGAGPRRSHSVLGLSTTELHLRDSVHNLCDPRHIPTADSNNSSDSRHPTSAQTPASISLRHLHHKNIRKASSTTQDNIQRRYKLRPLSWFSLPKRKSSWTKARGLSMPFSQPSSIASVSRSHIGTPTLTSTSNALIASAENVEQSNVLLPDHASYDAGIRRDVGLNIQAVGYPNNTDARSFTWSSTVRSMKRKLVHRRRASTSVLLETPWARRAAERKRYGVATSHSPCQVQNQIHACKEKVAERHEHGGPVLGKPFGYSSSCLSVTDSPEPLNTWSSPSSGLPPRLPGLYSASTTDILASSLTKSFASTIDKLDFDSSPTPVGTTPPLSKLKKARSYLSLQRFARDISERSLEPANTTHSTEFAKALLSPDQGSILVQHPGRTGEHQTKKPKIRCSAPMQLRFSSEKKRYVHSDPDPHSPRGVNPLRMHPEIKTFARALSGEQPVKVDQLKQNIDTANSSTDRRSGSIDRAIIYEPSTGTLSEYSRTPSPKQASPNSPLTTRPPQETPTRKPLRKTGGAVLKKGVSNFLEKSASMIKIANFSPAKPSRIETSLVRTSRRLSWPNDTFMSDRASVDLRIRSSMTPMMQSSESLRAGWDYQPSSPSPLRKSTKINTTSRGRQRAVTTTTPVRVPTEGIMLNGARSLTVLSDPEKRWGKYIHHRTTDDATILY